MHPDGRKRQAAAEALAKVFKENIRLFTLITNTLAKDKEISDRWRGFKDVADSRHLANRVEPEVVDALVASVRAAYPRTAHRYYAMKAKWLGKPKLAYWDRNAPLPDRPERVVPWRGGGSDGARCLRRASRRDMATIAKRFFDGALDRRAGARGQVARRLLASDRAVRAPLHPDELPGQGARRHDARPRAGPRRAPGAGGAARSAAGADAADAGRDRIGVRRDADLQGAAGLDQRRQGEEGPAGAEGGGHDQHGRAPDRLLFLRARACTRSARPAS